MIIALLLAAMGHTAAAPSAVQVAQAKAHLKAEAEAQRAAIDLAIKRRLIGGGYFQLVSDKGEQRVVVAGFEKRLRSIGIPASVGQCAWIGLVADGFARSNQSYGGACRVRIASRPTADFLICDASFGGISLIKTDWFAGDAEYIETFIRRACF
ncbi:MAG: hypothetical protein ACJ8FS_13580 [Sphingomicrobium sp.]